MNISKVYEKFEGYNAYPAGEGEEMIRGRLSALFKRLIEKNEACFAKVRDKGLEKIMSRVLQVKIRMERMKDEMDHRFVGGEYSFNKFSAAEESELKDIDLSLENLMDKTYEIMDSMDCLETDMHISDRFATVSDCLRDIEHLCHKRTDMFKKMRVYG
jgi:hypothetical protein